MDTASHAGESAAALAERCAEAMYARDEASRALGIELLEIAPGHAVMQMSIKPWMANGDGICHGGMLFSLADSTMAFASNSRNEVYVAVSTSIEFLSPGRVGETVRATATEAHRAGRTATYTVSVSDGSGAPVAQFLGRVYRVSGDVIDGPDAPG